MSSKNTWLWLTTATALFVFIFLFERYRPRAQNGPTYLLPGFDPKSIQTVQIRPNGQLGIRVERTNGVWRIVDPVVYPAQGTNILMLLEGLQKLTVAHRISEHELRKDPKADEDYGIEPPQISLVLNSGAPIYFGHRTSPGDQVFVRLIGIEGVSIVDADVLNLFPKDANAWRDTTLANLTQIAFDRILITNTVKSQSFLLQRDPTNKFWTMAFPMKARADRDKVDIALNQLQISRIRQFVSDDPKADLESYGLQPPALTVAFAEGTNGVLAFDFGKEATNSPGLVYARRRDQNSIVAVSTNALAEWQSSFDIFRDRHLTTMVGAIDTVAVHGRDDFFLKWQTNDTWRVMPQNFTADTILATGFARKLADLQAAEFVKDSVPDPELPHYGLAPTPARKYVITWGSSLAATNPPTELDFGTNASGQVFARRVGEDAVYGITPLDYESLPAASWELRDRQIWNFGIEDIAQLTIQQNGQARQIVRNNTNGWSLAAGSKGIINVSAIEDTARELGHLSAFAWIGHGAGKLEGFGINAASYQLTIQLKNGEKLNVQLGNPSRVGSPYASVLFDGEPWIFIFPPDLYSSVQFCLTVPPPP